VVVEGASSVDEAILTGESMPVDKQAGDPVFAGTINGNGALRLRMVRAAAETTLARIVRMVEKAQEHKAVAQRVIERWQGPYVTGVLAVSAVAIVAHLITGGDFSAALMTGMVLLVAASPCAVVLASPVAVLAAVTRGAHEGVLFKGGSHLERLAIVRTMAFDKTGTVTRGQPVVVGVDPLESDDADALLALAAAVERQSEHPLAHAIVSAAVRRGLPLVDVASFGSDPGLGVWGRVAGRWVGVGRPVLFERQGVTLPDELVHRSADGAETRILIYHEGGCRGAIRLADEIRPEAKGALESLQRLGIQRLIMLTGDHAASAARVAAELGLREFKAGLRPEEKLAEIRRLAKDGEGIAMVGDGVNDAPALAAATVGIAMGAAGSDVALETADVVLMRGDLRGLVEAVRLARRCRRTIEQSLLAAFSVIGVLVLLTLVGWLALPAAVVCHEGSTVLVVLNGLRLLRKSDPGIRS
jgi:Cd2+/Zn2+-exporting ATPase